MKIFFVLSIALLSTGATASPTFSVRGEGFYCYQERTQALENAKAHSAEQALQICNGEMATRISPFLVLPPNQYCQVVVEARYVCQ